LALARCTAAPDSYQPRVAFTIRITESMTGTSTSTPTTVARAAPDSKPNRLIAAATALEEVAGADQRSGRRDAVRDAELAAEQIGEA
jgi:hypothetical protein